MCWMVTLQGEKSVTIKEWKSKHPKCIYCVYSTSYTHETFLNYNEIWCKAKMKAKKYSLPRFLCALFKTRN